ncbi:MAG: T9SS type A sorting domain-containing protein [candidate division WOR-3 bacterium]|nr:MAG: T9SS type A sorting domain-containing protein [candidate division WOR-3 bacterium]
MRLTLAFLLGLVAAATAQSYRCDWSVVGSGGGEMSSSTYRCGSTAGQTGSGFLTGAEFLAVVGFWQADYQVGIAEKQGPVFPKVLITGLEAVSPNPFREWAQVRYSLAAEGPVSIVFHDLAGRAVRTLVNGPQGAGRYTAGWRGDDDAGRELANGVYFCRFRVGDLREVRKLLLTR